jgi:hypothetical protein
MRIKTLALFALLLFATSCVTKINVKPATSTAIGTRYSLPKPLLKVTPQADGTAKFEWVYIPDDDRTYAIATANYFAKQKTTIELETNGLLKKVSWAPVSSDVAAQLITNATEVTKARLTAIETAQKEAQKKLDDAEKAIQTVRDEVTAAEDEVAALEAERAVHIEHKAEAKVQEIDVKLAVARAKVEAKKRKLDALLTAGSPAGAPNEAEDDATGAPNEVEDDTAPPNPPSAPAVTPSAPTPPAPAQFTKSWGPLFFEIVEESSPRHTVKFVPINAQQQFATSKKPKAATDKPSPPLFTLKGGAAVVKDGTNTPLHVLISSSVPLTSVNRSRVILRNAAGQNVGAQFFSTAALTSATEIDVVLKPSIPVDTYTFSIPYETAAGLGATRIEVSFAIGEAKKK